MFDESEWTAFRCYGKEKSMFTNKSKNLTAKHLSVITTICATAALTIVVGSTFAGSAPPPKATPSVPLSTTGPKVNVQGFVNGTTGALTESKGVITVMNPGPGRWCIELGGTAKPTKEIVIATPEYSTSPTVATEVQWASNAVNCNSLSVEILTFDNTGLANESFSFIGLVG
jgi:hypothetical protein